MPKKPKLIICPRCHRTIPAEEFNDHLSQHKGKKNRLHSKPATKETKTKYPEFQPFTIPSAFGKEVFEKYVASKSNKSDLSESQILSKFEASLKDTEADYPSLKIEATQDPLVIEVKFAEDRNLLLRYNPISLKALTEKAIDGLLLHEACHVCTLPDTMLYIPALSDPDMVRFLGNSLTNYDEYLAHVEFVKRFRNDPRFEGLKEQQTGLFTNFEIIVSGLKKMTSQLQARGQSLNQFWILEQLGAITYDSLFFFVAKDDSFANWCKSNSLNELETFVGWFHEDFENIRSLNLSHKASHDKVMASATLSMSVNPTELMVRGQMEFADTTKGLHEEWMKKGTDIDLVQLWEKRRQLYQTNSQ
jgi:hypothetical protein